MTEVFQMVYISQAPEDIAYTDIEDILGVARVHNASENITGVLIFRDGYFMQLLEGDEDSVRDLVERIKHDDRNYALRVLIEDKGERLFRDWSMAFLDGDISANETLELVNLFNLAVEKRSKNADMIMPMIKVFLASAPLIK